MKKVFFLKKEILYLNYKQIYIKINLNRNILSFRTINFRFIELQLYLDFYTYPFIYDYLEKLLPKEIRKYKIRKLLNNDG